MLIPSAYCNTADNSDPGRFALLIDIEVEASGRAAIARRLEEYLQQLRLLFQENSGYLGAELHDSDDNHLLGCLSWRRRADWEAAWDCESTRNELFADSLLRLGARSIQFDSFLIAERP